MYLLIYNLDMKNHAEEVITKKPEKGRRLHLFFLNLGKLILDATKLSFGSLVLGTILGVILVTIFEEK